MRSPRPVRSLGFGERAVGRPGPLSRTSMRISPFVSIVIPKSVRACRTAFVASSEAISSTVSTVSRGQAASASRAIARAADTALGVQSKRRVTITSPSR